MKKRILSLLLALCLLAGLFPVLPAFAADAPDKLYLAPSSASNIPSQIDLYPDPSGTANLYHMYLPGNASAANCFLSWEGGASATLNGRTYASGTLPIPAPGQTETVTFSGKTFNIRTYQGSASVHPIFVEIDESQGTIAAMNADPNHETICVGEIVIDGQRMALPQMKGRGNATWRDDKEKKPYNIKLDKKITLPWIDCAKTKKWSLLSNVNDRTLLRNKVAYDLAHKMGIGFDSASVDLWMNGVYWGTYLLTPKTDSYVTDDGYLIEDNNISDSETPHIDGTGMILNIKDIGDNLIIAEGGDPDNPDSRSTQAAASKISSFFKEAWSAVTASNGTSSQGKHYSDYFDVNSMAAFYLLHEFIKNLEVDGGSIFVHRDGTSDTDKLIAGPAWDYDNSMGYNGSNGSMASGGSGWPRSPLNYASLSVGNWYITGRNRGKLFGTFSKHQDFLDLTHEVYNRYYAAFDDVSQNVRRQAELIADSAEMNFVRTVKEDKNNFDFPQGNTRFDEGTEYEVNYKAAETWPDYVDNLVTFTSGRARFFHDQMYVDSTCDHEYESVTFVPTCTSSGYTSHTCVKCGEGYIDNEIPALGHNFVEGVCTRCGDRAMQATFVCSEGVSVTVYKTQTLDGEYTENAATAFPRNSTTGEIDVSGDGQVNFVVNVADGYRLESVTAKGGYKNLKGPDETLVNNAYRVTKITGNLTVTVTATEVGPCEHDYKAAVTAPTCTAQGFTTFTCSKCGDSYVGDYTDKIPHDYKNGACAVCGEKLLSVAISCDAGATVTVYETQKLDSPHVDNATSAYPRDGDSGLIDCSGEGQVNLVVQLKPGYSLKSITAAPADSYKNLKGPADTGIENGYRFTKVTDSFTITVTTAQGEIVPCEHEFVDGVCTKCGEAAPKISFVCDAGVTVDVSKSQTAGSEVFTNVTTAYPRSSETGEIDVSGEGQVNFTVRLPAGFEVESVTAEPASGYKNLKGPDETLVSNGYRITKITGDLTVTVKARQSGAGPHEHDYKAVVTPPTCTEQGYTTYTCTVCGDSYTDDEVYELLHDWPREGVVTKQATQTARGELTFTCARCGATKTRPIAAGNEKAHKNEILFISDPHSARKAEEGNHNLRAMFRLLREYDDFIPEVVAGGGDYLESRTYDDVDWAHCYEVMRDIMYDGSPDTVQVLTPGNHDWEWSRQSEEMLEKLLGVPRVGNTYVSEDFEIFQIGAHTNDGEPEEFLEEDIEKLRAYLASRAGCGKVIFIQTHWPLHYGYNSSEWRTTKNAEDVIDLLNEYADSLDIVFVWGHNHNEDETRHECMVRGDELQYTKRDSKEIQFTYVNAGCLNERHADEDAGPSGSYYGPGYLLEARIVGDKLILDYGHITDAYPDPANAEYDHNADLLYVDEIEEAKESHHEIGNETAALGHSWNAGVVTVQPTETSTGVRTFTCTRCGQTRTEVIPELTHVHRYTAVVTAPTCTEGGYTTHTCTCGDSYVDSETPALGHSFGAWSVSKAAACTEKGEESRTCARCGETETRALDALGHDYRAVVTAPTCTTAGFTTHTCSRCGSSYTDGTTAALGHDWGEGVITKQPTETEKGERTYTCSRCGEKRTESIPELSHVHSYTAVVTAPTCTEGGYTTHTCACGDSYVDSETPALGHDYKAAVTAPTCTEAGFTTYTCSRCGDSYRGGEVAATGHSFGEWAVSKAATCTAEGEEIRTCANCGEKETRKLDKIAHDYKDGKCTVCGEADPDYKPPVDYTALDAAIEAAEKLDPSKYTDDTADALKKALEAAKAAKTAGEQADVDSAKDALEAAVKALKEKPVEEPFRFDDVKNPNDYFYTPVYWAYEHEPQITKGTSDTLFSPNAGCTRAQVVTFLWRAKGQPEPKTTANPFADVQTGVYYYKAVLWAVEEGVTTGTSATTFRPDQTCTRAQIVTFLWRAEGKPAPGNANNPFTDVKTGEYYTDAVLWAVENGVTTGTSADRFSPNTTCTRAQIVTFLYRAMKE